MFFVALFNWPSFEIELVHHEFPELDKLVVPLTYQILKNEMLWKVQLSHTMQIDYYVLNFHVGMKCRGIYVLLYENFDIIFENKDIYVCQSVPIKNEVNGSLFLLLFWRIVVILNRRRIPAKTEPTKSDICQEYLIFVTLENKRKIFYI